MIKVTGGQAGKFEVQFGPTETLAIRHIANDYGLTKHAVVGSIVHKGFESWRQAVLDQAFERALAEGTKRKPGG